MSDLNHYAISAILHSEIVGPVEVAHGQIASLGDAQRYFDVLAADERPAGTGRRQSGEINIDRLKQAFFAARETFKDRGSTDLYIADPKRNEVFLALCRRFGIKASDYRINKTLFNARKNKLLPGLKSERTSIEYGEFAFASEFAATQLRYKAGASIDDILCDPDLASQFDTIAREVTPGFSSFEYRWAILSIRKAGRHQRLPASFRLPKFTTGFRLLRDPIEQIPDQSGVYLLFERQKLLYTRSAVDLRHGVELHRNANILKAINERLWRPDPANFIVDFATVNRPMSFLQAIERKLVEERHPVFNIPRSAA
jgi:site-specific DNA-methyltransferase (adenine-specific)